MQDSFYTEGLFEDTHSFCGLHDSVFALGCGKCPFKGKTQGDLQKHILWLHEGKGPQCGLCDYKPTQKSAMTKHIELIYGQLTKYKEPSSVFVLSVDFPLPPKQDMTNTLNVRWEPFQLWTLLKDIFPESCASAAPESSRRWKAKRLSALWESIHNRLSSQKTWSKSSQCGYKEVVQGKNRLVKLNEFVKTNMLQTIKCLGFQSFSGFGIFFWHLGILTILAFLASLTATGYSTLEDIHPRGYPP